MEVMKPFNSLKEQPSLSVRVHLERDGGGSEQWDVCNSGASHSMWEEQGDGGIMCHRNNGLSEQRAAPIG